MEIGKQLYEGKAKKVFATDDEKVVLVDYKDDATAFNGLKKGQIAGKGVINNKMSNMMFRLLEQHGVETRHLVTLLAYVLEEDKTGYQRPRQRYEQQKRTAVERQSTLRIRSHSPVVSRFCRRSVRSCGAGA